MRRSLFILFFSTSIFGALPEEYLGLWKIPLQQNHFQIVEKAGAFHLVPYFDIGFPTANGEVKSRPRFPNPITFGSSKFITVVGDIAFPSTPCRFPLKMELESVTFNQIKTTLWYPKRTLLDCTYSSDFNAFSHNTFERSTMGFKGEGAWFHIDSGEISFSIDEITRCRSTTSMAGSRLRIIEFKKTNSIDRLVILISNYNNGVPKLANVEIWHRGNRYSISDRNSCKLQTNDQGKTLSGYLFCSSLKDASSKIGSVRVDYTCRSRDPE